MFNQKSLAILNLLLIPLLSLNLLLIAQPAGAAFNTETLLPAKGAGDAPSIDKIKSASNLLKTGSTNEVKDGSQDLIAIIGKFINIILGLVGVVLFVLILVAGGMWMTAAGNEDRVKNAQKIIRQAVVGVVVIVLAFALSNFVITLLTNSGALSS